MAEALNEFKLVVHSTRESVNVSANVLEYRVDISYTDLVDKFNIKLFTDNQAAKAQFLFLLMPFNFVTIYINGCVQMEGIIFTQRITDHGVIEISGMDYLGSFMQACSIGKVVVPQAINVGEALLKGLNQFGIVEIVNGFSTMRSQMTGVSSSSDVATDYKNIKVSEKHGKPNEAVSQFCLRILKRSGLFLLPGVDRSKVCLSIPNYEQRKLYDLIRTNRGDGNIISGDVTRDFTNIPTTVTWKGATPIDSKQAYVSDDTAYGKAVKYITDPETLPAAPRRKRTTLEYPVFGAKSPHEIGRNVQNIGIIDERLLLNKSDTGEPGNGNRLYRPLVIDDSESKNVNDLHRYAIRELSTRLRETLQATYTVSGHTATNGAVYSIDTIIGVKDATGAINEEMWINRVVHSRTRSTVETQIEVWRAYSYVESGD